jgi:hypothetical protein
MSFRTVNSRKEKYIDMDNDTAREEYLNYIPKLTWAANFSFAYGSTFAGDTDSKAPYIQLPAQSEDGIYLQDNVWELYDYGYGNLTEKLDEYGENLLKLKGIIIEYGTRDEYKWIPEGCEYFSTLLNERNIAHELVSFDGNHQSIVFTRISEEVLPYFSKILISQ